MMFGPPLDKKRNSERDVSRSRTAIHRDRTWLSSKIAKIRLNGHLFKVECAKTRPYCVCFLCGTRDPKAEKQTGKSCFLVFRGHHFLSSNSYLNPKTDRNTRRKGGKKGNEGTKKCDLSWEFKKYKYLVQPSLFFREEPNKVNTATAGLKGVSYLSPKSITKTHEKTRTNSKKTKKTQKARNYSRIPFGSGDQKHSSIFLWLKARVFVSGID